MSLSGPPTEAELRARFDELITGAPEHGVPSDTGLDGQTLSAIERAWTNTSPALVAAARQELELQIDGTHAAEGDAAATKAFAAVMSDTTVSPSN